MTVHPADDDRPPTAGGAESADGATSDDDRPDRRRPLYAIAGVVALVALVALVMAVTGGDGGDSQNIAVDDTTGGTLAPTGELAADTGGDQSGDTNGSDPGDGDDDDPDDDDDDSGDGDSERTDVGASRPDVIQPFRCADEPDRCLDRFEVDGFDGLWNVGGGDFTDDEGHRWSAADCIGGNTYESPNEIDGTDDDRLFQSRRFEPTCSFAVEPGLYRVLVGWAETYDATPGYRVFPLVMEGSDRAVIDVGRAVGINRPFIQSYEVNVIDDRLDVVAPPQENRSMLAAIAYERIGDPLPVSEVELTASQAIPLDRSTGGPSDITELVRTLTDGDTRTVGPGGDHPTLQDALEDVEPGQIIRLLGAGPHPGPARTVRSGTASAPIVITADPGAYLECPSPNDGEVARCLQLGHSSYRIVGFAVVGGSSNLYMVGDGPGQYVTDVKVLNSVFRGSPAGGTGECIRIKYQASAIEIAGNDIADCGLGKCCNDSKNGEGVYIGTAPEQLKEKNPSPERDETTDVWVHHNTIRSLNECVEAKEAVHSILVEYNSCKGQADEESGGFGSRGGLVGRGNVFRFNLVENAAGACIRFGGDDEPDGTGNDFYGNVCRDIGGEYGVKQQRDPQGLVCGNVFAGSAPSTRPSRNKGVDPTAACPAGTPVADGQVGAGRPNEG